jgi:hypothetical protein
MSTRRVVPFVLVLIAVIGLTLLAPAAQAQATRTWVSGVGDDANPCSRTAPCKTFAGAISKTAPRGEISVLDPGGFGSVTIGKSITINGYGQIAGILNSTGFNGIVVNAGVNDVVTLRHLTVHGVGTGGDAIRYVGGKSLVLENIEIRGWAGDGIEMNVTGLLQLRNVNITEAAVGLKVSTPTIGQRASVSWDGGNITSCPVGVQGLVRSNIALRNILISGATTGVSTDGSTSEVNIDEALITQNGTGLATTNSATARISNVFFAANVTAINNGGTVVSFINNRFGGNVNPNAGNAVSTQNQQ